MIKTMKGWIAFATFVAVAGMFVLADAVMAHPGGVSKRDGCHTDRSTGSLHWHAEGSREAIGPCERKGDVTVKTKVEKHRVEIALPTKVVEAPCPACLDADVATSAELKTAERELSTLRSLLDASRSAEVAWRDRVRGAEGRADAAENEAKAMRFRASELAEELRAVRSGASPCVAQRERLATRIDETWASGWRDDARRLVGCLRGD